MNKIHEDLKEIDKAGFVAYKMGGGNAGAALGGCYIAQAINGLTKAVLQLADRPIIVNVQAPPAVHPPIGQPKAKK